MVAIVFSIVNFLPPTGLILLALTRYYDDAEVSSVAADNDEIIMLSFFIDVDLTGVSYFGSRTI